MKYQAPTQGPYESGLTARLLYNVVGGLMKRHITHEDIRRTDEKYKSHSPEKLWEKPEIRSELEEFVMSYLIDNLQAPLPGFEAVFIRDEPFVRIKKENLDGYIAALEQEYGSRDEAYRAVSELFMEIEKRGKRLRELSREIARLKKATYLIKRNARDAFGQVADIYTSLQLDMDEAVIQT